MDSSVGRATGNVFLDMMPAASRDRLQPFLRRQSFKLHDKIYGIDEVIDVVYFPIDAIISVVIDLADGETAESGIIGREGTTGHILALGQIASTQRIFVQVAGTSQAVDATEFRAALDRDPVLRAYVLRFTQATIASLTQSAACNVLHPANERCARWLLMAHDRVPDDVMLLTQEFLGQMLGLRRGSVALATAALQAAGIVSYSRGKIVVRNRANLEMVSCECYGSLEAVFERIMGYSISKSAALGSILG